MNADGQAHVTRRTEAAAQMAEIALGTLLFFVFLVATIVAHLVIAFAEQRVLLDPEDIYVMKICARTFMAAGGFLYLCFILDPCIKGIKSWIR